MTQIRNCAVLIGFVLGMVMGCAKSGRIDTVDVAGKLTVDGKPLGPVLLVLTPQDKDGKVVNGYVKNDGSFKLGTYEEADGAPVGIYKVTLSADPMAPGNVPAIKETTVDIKKPASGSTLALEVKLEATAGGGMVSPLGRPGSEGGTQRSTGPLAFPSSTADDKGDATPEAEKK